MERLRNRYVKNMKLRFRKSSIMEEHVFIVSNAILEYVMRILKDVKEMILEQGALIMKNVIMGLLVDQVIFGHMKLNVYQWVM